MSSTATALPRDLGRDLRLATDEQLSRVLAVIDSMSSRGAADELVQLIRPRLAMLRPDRPLSLSRIMFAPLDPVIVAPRRWRQGMAAVPRSALAVVSKAVMAGLGPLGAELERAVSGHRASEHEVAHAIGAQLWPAAAAILRPLATPAEWTDRTGLSAAVWVELRDGIACVLNGTARLEAALHARSRETLLRDIVLEAASLSASGVALMIKILLERHPRPVELVGTIMRLGEGRASAAAFQAIDTVLDEVPGTLDEIGTQATSSAAAIHSVQLASMLDAADTPSRRGKVEALRSRAREVCHARMERCLQDEVVDALRLLPAADGAAFTAIEQAARDAKRLESAAGRLGGKEEAGHSLQLSASAIGAMPSPGLDEVDRARLVEILVGPEAAITCLEGRASAPATGAS